MSSLFSPHLIDIKAVGTIIVADDHPMFRHAMVSCVGANFPSASVLEADTLDCLQDLLNRDQNVDLVLLDLNMPGSHGLSGLIHVRAKSPGLSVAVISAQEEPLTIRRALQLGAAGFIPKSAPLREISKALGQVLSGSRYIPASLSELGFVPQLSSKEQSAARQIGALSAQQFRIASMLATGMLNKQIAAQLQITEATVKVHMKSIMQKLDARNRTQVALMMQTFDATQSIGDG